MLGLTSKACCSPHLSTTLVLCKLGLGDPDAVSGSEIQCPTPPRAGYQNPRWDGEMGGGWGVVKEMSLTTLVIRESRPWVRKAPSLIHHAPLNPLSYSPAILAFYFSIFCKLHPPAADRLTLQSFFWWWWKEEGTKRMVQCWTYCRLHWEMKARWDQGSSF